jgi:hypothetical protein
LADGESDGAAVAAGDDWIGFAKLTLVLGEAPIGWRVVPLKELSDPVPD